MTAPHSSVFTPDSAERLLDGQGGPAPLARLLSAASAPGRPHEFDGEDIAVAAFEAHYARHPAAPRRSGVKASLAGLLTAKFLALAAAVGGTGAVALTAATWALGGPPPPAPHAAQVSPNAVSASAPSARATGGPVRARLPESAAPSPQVSSPQVDGPAALCRDLAAHAGQSQAGLEQALASPGVPGLLGGARYRSLVAAAGDTLAVPDYCALLMGLPALPQPGELAQIPAPVLSRMLEELPVPTLSTVLTGLPAGPLGQVLGKLPSSAASTLLARLPAATQARILAKLPPKQAPGTKAGLPTPLPSRLTVG